MLSPVQPWLEKKTGLGVSLNRHTLEQWQFSRLRDQLAYARKHSPYYAEQLAGLDLDAVSGRADLSRLPFMPSQILRAQPQKLLCMSGSQVARVTTLNTSGSTGDTKRVYFSQGDLARIVDFFAYGMTTLIEAGQQILILLSDNSPNSLGDLLQRALKDINVQSVIHGPIRDAEAAFQAAANAHCLVGLPAQINRLCLSAPNLRPLSVLLTADYVPEIIVRKIKQTWGSDVFTHYGMTETGYGLAVQCAAHEACHLRDTDFIVEIIDPDSGQNLPDGELGEVVLTSLVNEAMPLIRYRTGDLAQRIVTPCACGGCLPRLGKVQGRAANTLLPYPIHALDEALFCLPDLLDYCAELLPENGLRLTLDSLIPYSEAKVRQVLRCGGVEPPLLKLRYQTLPVFAGQAKRTVRAATDNWNKN